MFPKQEDGQPEEVIVNISVIIPVYNGAPTIADTLDSVIRQRHPRLEIIVVDDGSTDDLRGAIARWTQSHQPVLQKMGIVIQLFHFENAGPSMARNRGIERSQGKYIAFLDADDQWSVDKLRAQALVLDQRPEVGLVYSWTDCVDSLGTFVCPGSYRSSDSQAAVKLLLQNYIDNGSSPMVRRAVLDDVGLFNPDLRCAEDWDLWIRIAEKYPIVAIPSPQVRYQIARYSSSNDTQRMERSARQVLECALERQYGKSLTPKQRKEVRFLRNRSLANLYLYLYGKIFSGGIQRRRIPPAMFYCFQIYRYEGRFRKDTKMVLRAIAKVICLSLLPNRLAQKVLNRLGQANTVHAEMLSYISSDVEP